MDFSPQAQRHLQEAEKKLRRKGPYLHSIILTVLVLCAYFLGYGLDEMVPTHVTAAVIGALWSAVTVLAVFKDQWKETRHSFWATLAAGLVGALAALLYLLFFPQGMLTLALVMALSLLVSQWIGFSDRGRQVVSTVLLIVIFSHLNSDAPWLNAGMRMAEVAIGAMVGVIGGFLLRNFPVSEE